MRHFLFISAQALAVGSFSRGMPKPAAPGSLVALPRFLSPEFPNRDGARFRAVAISAITPGTDVDRCSTEVAEKSPAVGSLRLVHGLARPGLLRLLPRYSPRPGSNPQAPAPGAVWSPNSCLPRAPLSPASCQLSGSTPPPGPDDDDEDKNDGPEESRGEKPESRAFMQPATSGVLLRGSNCRSCRHSRGAT